MKDFVLAGHTRKRREWAEKSREGIVDFNLFIEM